MSVPKEMDKTPPGHTYHGERYLKHANACYSDEISTSKAKRVTLLCENAMTHHCFACILSHWSIEFAMWQAVSCKVLKLGQCWSQELQKLEERSESPIPCESWPLADMLLAGSPSMTVAPTVGKVSLYPITHMTYLMETARLLLLISWLWRPQDSLRQCFAN